MTSAEQQAAECKTRDIIYNKIEMLQLVDKERIPIGEKTKKYFDVGECYKMAILILEDSRIFLFLLDKEIICKISTITDSLQNNERLLRLAEYRRYWEELTLALPNLSDSGAGCVLYLVWVDGDIAVVKVGSLSDSATIYFKSKVGAIKHFINNLFGSHDYMSTIFSTWKKLSYKSNVIKVAGDNGLILAQGGRHIFIEYPSRYRIAVCDIETILKRFEKMPRDTWHKAVQVAVKAEDEIYKLLAQYGRRSALRSIAFGC